MRADEAEAAVSSRARGLLADLAVHERNAIQRTSQVQYCEAGDVLQHANTRSTVAVFPISAVASVMRPMHPRSFEIGVVGPEGMFGMDVVLEGGMPNDEVVVQSAGFVYSMPADDVRHLFDSTARLQRSMLRFVRTFLDQVVTNAACARQHPLPQRLAKWLLMVDDRAGQIGVKSRGNVAAAFGTDGCEIDSSLALLVSRGAIAHRRSTITVRRDALEAEACECYEALRIESDAAAR